jgi:hypothetical protein
MISFKGTHFPKVDESVYEMIRQAADGQKRNMSNFVEFATLQYWSASLIFC